MLKIYQSSVTNTLSVQRLIGPGYRGTPEIKGIFQTLETRAKREKGKIIVRISEKVIRSYTINYLPKIPIKHINIHI